MTGVDSQVDRLAGNRNVSQDGVARAVENPDLIIVVAGEVQPVRTGVSIAREAAPRTGTALRVRASVPPSITSIDSALPL